MKLFESSTYRIFVFLSSITLGLSSCNSHVRQPPNLLSQTDFSYDNLINSGYESSGRVADISPDLTDLDNRVFTLMDEPINREFLTYKKGDTISTVTIGLDNQPLFHDLTISFPDSTTLASSFMELTMSGNKMYPCINSNFNSLSYIESITVKDVRSNLNKVVLKNERDNTLIFTNPIPR